VADVQDADALRRQPAQRLEQLEHRIRRQHRSRLVHDQQLGRLQQAAHDLDALALAHRHAVHQPRGSSGKPYCSDTADARRQRGRRHLVVQRQRDVLGHRQRLEQGEVLEHHADAQLARIVR
jgi:hypothetical protein